MPFSLESGNGVAVPREGSVDDSSSSVVQVGHNRLVLRSVPRNISRSSLSVSVTSLVVLMEDWVLPGPPLSVGIGHWRVSGQHAGQVPPVQVGVVQEGTGVEALVVRHHWPLVSEATADTLGPEEHNPSVDEPASGVEVLNRKLSDDQKAEKAPHLGAGSIASPVVVRAGTWSHVHVLGLAPWEPGSEHSEIGLSLRSPIRHPLFNFMRRDTETDEVVILNVVGDLPVDHSLLPIIECVLQE